MGRENIQFLSITRQATSYLPPCLSFAPPWAPKPLISDTVTPRIPIFSKPFRSRKVKFSNSIYTKELGKSNGLKQKLHAILANQDNNYLREDKVVAFLWHRQLGQTQDTNWAFLESSCTLSTTTFRINETKRNLLKIYIQHPKVLSEELSKQTLN